MAYPIPKHSKTDVGADPPQPEQITSLANALWQGRGCLGSSPEADWLTADLELTLHVDGEDYKPGAPSWISCVPKPRNREPFDYEAFLARTQTILIEMLSAELRVGPRLVESASRARIRGHLDHYVRDQRSAVKAAEFIQRFVNRVTDDTVRNEITGKLADLDRLIATLG